MRDMKVNHQIFSSTRRNAVILTRGRRTKRIVLCRLYVIVRNYHFVAPCVEYLAFKSGRPWVVEDL